MSTLSSDSKSSRSGKPSSGKRTALASAKSPKKRRWPRRLAIALAGYALLMWVLPILVAWTPLRNRALAMALPGLNGTITSGGASLGWFSPVVFTEVEIRDRAGNRLVTAAAARSDKTLLQLALSQTDLGTIRIEQPDATLEMRAGGSNAEDVLVPFLKSGSGGGPLTIQLAFVGGTINMHDVAADRRWKIEQFETSLKLEPKNPAPLECSVSGNAIVDGKPAHFSLAYKESGAGPGARGEGVDASAKNTATGPIQFQAQIEPLPMEMFRPLVARWLPDAEISGLLSGSLKYSTETAANGAAIQTPTTLIAGQVRVDQLDVTAPALGGDHLRLTAFQMPCEIVCQGQQITVRQLGVDCDVGRLSVSGSTTWPATGASRTIAEWLRQSFNVQGELDLAHLARLLPQTLHVRQDIAITSGGVSVSLASTGDAKLHRWTGQLQASNLAATTAGRPVTWSQPISIDFAAHDTPTGPLVEQLECQSSFVHLTASGTPDRFTASAKCDLNQLAAELGQFVDFGAVRPAGVGQVTLDWQRAADNTFQTTANAQINNLQLAMPGQVWSEPSLTVNASAAGRISQSGPTRVDRASLEITNGATPPAAADRLSVALLEPVADAKSAASAANWHVAIALQGDLAHWQSRLAPWVSLADWQLGGACDASAKIAYSPSGIGVEQAHAVVNRLHAWGGAWFIDEPTLQFDGAASWDVASRTLKLAPSILTSNTLALQAKDTTLKLPSSGAVTVTGTIAWQADLARLANWTHDPRKPVAMLATGRFSGQANVTESGALATAQLSTAIDNLSVAEAARPNAPFWQEKRLAISAGGKLDRSADALNVESFDVTSTALHLQGAGQIAKLSGTADVNLAGQVDYDWQTLGPLLRPYLGTQFQIAGRQSRQFSVHGPLAAPVTPAGATDSLAWLRPLVIEAGSGWSSARYGNIQFAAAQFDAQLADGTLTLVKPLTLSLSEGQLVLSPRLRLSPGPVQLTLDKGPLVRQVRLSPEMCSQWLKYVSPLVDKAARAQGQFSIDLAGGRIPLDVATKCDVAGQLTIVSADINPGPIIRPFSLLSAQLKAILNGQLPPLAAGSDVPLVHYPQQTVDFRVVNQRVYHERIEMKIGDMTVRTHGSVGLVDESLVLEAEVPIRTTPPLIGLGQPQTQEQIVRIPIEGTLGNPKLDPRAVETLAAQLVKNGARNTIRDGLDKIGNGLEKIDNLVKPNR